MPLFMQIALGILAAVLIGAVGIGVIFGLWLCWEAAKNHSNLEWLAWFPILFVGGVLVLLVRAFLVS